MTTPRIQPDSAETSQLLRQIMNGDGSARGRLLERHLPTIRKCVARRIDPRLQPRVDLSDVVQETQLDLVIRLALDVAFCLSLKEPWRRSHARRSFNYVPKTRTMP